MEPEESAFTERTLHHTWDGESSALQEELTCGTSVQVLTQLRQEVWNYISRETHSTHNHRGHTWSNLNIHQRNAPSAGCILPTTVWNLEDMVAPGGQVKNCDQENTPHQTPLRFRKMSVCLSGRDLCGFKTSLLSFTGLFYDRRLSTLWTRKNLGGVPLCPSRPPYCVLTFMCLVSWLPGQREVLGLNGSETKIFKRREWQQQLK